MRDWDYMIRDPFARDSVGPWYEATFTFPTASELIVFRNFLRTLLQCESDIVISHDPHIIEVEWAGEFGEADVIEDMFRRQQQCYGYLKDFEATWAENQLPRRRTRRSSREHRTDSLLRTVGFLVPRKSRQALIGDLIEDVAEQRAAGYSEWRIRSTVCWQLLFAMRMHIAPLAAWAIAAVRKLISG